MEKWKKFKSCLLLEDFQRRTEDWLVVEQSKVKERKFLVPFRSCNFVYFERAQSVRSNLKWDIWFWQDCKGEVCTLYFSEKLLSDFEVLLTEVDIIYYYG